MAPFGRWTFGVAMLLVFLLAGGTALPGCSCGDDDDDDDSASDDDDDDVSTDDDDDDDDDLTDVDALIQEGKDWLAFPEGDKARQSFMAALELEPDNREARYGVVLSDFVHSMDVYSVLTDYILSFIEYGGPVKSGAVESGLIENGKAEQLPGDDFLNNLLQIVIDGLFRERASELIEYADGLEGCDCAFMHPGIPIYVHYEKVMELAGEFDAGELYQSKAFAGSLSALFYHLYAINIDFDPFWLYALTEADFDDLDTLETISVVVDVLLNMLTDPGFPDFLVVTPGGQAIFRQAGTDLGDAMDDFLSTFIAVDAETDPQDEDVISWVDRNGNLVRDPDEPYRMAYFGELSDEQMAQLAEMQLFAEDLRNALYQGTDKDVNPDEVELLHLVLLRPIVASLGLPAGIIPDTTVDLSAAYTDIEGDNFKKTLVTILNLVSLVLPEVEL
ncbi:MAG: hypothetical protein H6685_07350 [Deltaproteobacteria bacterium]|nr:hypothetical protein [Deltaproteobacteria bacterium]